MGAQSFTCKATGYSAKECFAQLVDDAVREYGEDIYNGTISTCELGRCHKISELYSKESEKKGYEYIKQHGNGEKWTADVLDLGVAGYDVITVKKSAPPATDKKAKFAMKYAVRQNGNIVIKYFDTKTEADKYAAEKAVSDPVSTYCVAKCPVNIVPRSTDVTTRFETTVKRVEKKPKSKDCNMKEIHKYLFYGWAAC